MQNKNKNYVINYTMMIFGKITVKKSWDRQNVRIYIIFIYI